METIKTNQELFIAINNAKANFESIKQEKLAELEASKQEVLNQFPLVTKPEETYQLISELASIDKEIEETKKSTSDSLKLIKVVLFNGELYYGSVEKDTTSRIRTTSSKFQIGQNVKMSYQGIESETYRVIEGNKVIDSENHIYSPSILTAKFHTESLGKNPMPNGHGMAGFSHPYWISAE